jgi:hypothetical protein
MLGVAKIGEPRQLVGAQIRIHFENDRKFGLFTHCINFKCPREDLK